MMTKSPEDNRQNLIVYPEVPHKLLHQWKEMMDYAKVCTVSISTLLRDTVSDVMKNTIVPQAESEQSLSACDVKKQEQYKVLMANYGNAIKTYNDHVELVVGEQTKNIADGVVEILISRVKLFSEENQAFHQESIACNERDSEEGFKKVFEDLEKEMASLLRHFFMTGTEEKDKDILLEKLMAILPKEKWETIVKSSTEHCSADLEASRSGYQEMMTNTGVLEEEFAILTSLAEAQAVTLEKEMEFVSEAEKAVLKGLLEFLWEAFDATKVCLEDSLVAVAKQEESVAEKPEQEAKDISYSEMIHNAIDLALSQYDFTDILVQWHDKNKALAEIWMAEIVAQLDDIEKDLAMKAKVYAMNKTVFEQISMTDEFVSIFENVLHLIEKNVETIPPSDDKSIVLGVQETIEIKIESLKESKEYFAAEMEKMLRTFSEQHLAFREREVNSIFESCLETLLEKQDNFNGDETLEQVFAEIEMKKLLRGDLFLTVKEKAVRFWDQNQENLYKKITRYKKEYLLYEMSTYEEVVFYSVSRLRDSKDETVSLLVMCIDSETKKLLNCLEKYGVSVIQPNAHDMFNGKEHEVLMAEEQEGFQKGEIIKVMNCGYRQDDVILLRANVIAAK